MFTKISEELKYYNQLVRLVSEFEDSDEFKYLLDYSTINNKNFQLELSERTPHDTEYKNLTIIALHGVIDHKHVEWTDFNCTEQMLVAKLRMKSMECIVASSDDVDKYYEGMLKDYKSIAKRVLLMLKEEVKHD